MVIVKTIRYNFFPNTLHLRFHTWKSNVNIFSECFRLHSVGISIHAPWNRIVVQYYSFSDRENVSINLITRHATYFRTFVSTCPDHMQSFIKIGGTVFEKNVVNTQRDIHLLLLARLRRSPVTFLLNRAITRPATGSMTIRQPFPSYMQSFIKIRGAVLEKNANKTITLCNSNKD